MAFEPAGKFLFGAAKAFHMEPQARSGIVCAQVRIMLQTEFSTFCNAWEPITFESHTITIKGADSAARSALYMQQIQVLEACQKLDLPFPIKELKIL